MSVEAKWMEGLQFVVEIDGRHGLVLDGPDGVGPRPYELFLTGLAGCTAMDVISILQKKRQKITDFRVKVSGKKENEHPKVYQEIRIEYVVTGEDVSEEAVKRAIELSETKYCPAYATLRHSIQIENSYQVIEE